MEIDDLAEIVRAEFTRLLQRQIDQPFFDLRERDPQSELLGGLRRLIDPSGLPEVKIVPHNDKARRWHEHAGGLRTSRVHTELKVGGKKPSDVVIFRNDAPVSLTCWDPGPTDVVAGVRGDDVAVVIEMKASPSKTQHAEYSKDIEKLSRLQAQFPSLCTFFLLIDKSITVPGASSKAQPNYSWLDTLERAPGVEAWYLEADQEGPRIASRRGDTRPVGVGAT